MKGMMVIGLALVCLLTLGIDFYMLDIFVDGSLIAAQKTLWVSSGVMCLIMLIFFMLNAGRREKASDIISARGLAILDVLKFTAIGIMIFVGYYLAQSVFVII